MVPTVARTLTRHAAAAALAGAAAALRFAAGALDPALAPFVFFYPVVLLATLLWTAGPGVTALLASAVAATAIMVEAGRELASIWLNLALFLITGGLLVVLGDRLGRTTRRLEASEARLALLHRAARVGDWTFDPQTGDLRWSEGLAALMGVDPTRFKPSFDSMEALVDPADRTAWRVALRSALDHGDHFEIVYRVHRPDGALRWFATRGEVRRDGGGKAIRMTGLDIDMTERLEAERALAESRARTGRLFDAMTEGFLVGEAVRDRSGAVVDCRLVDANPAAARLVGQSPEALAGARIATLLGPVNPDWLAFVDRVVRTGAPDRMEGWSSTFRRWLEVYAYSIEADTFGLLIRDVTDRKSADLARDEALRQAEALFREMNHRIKNNLQMISSLLLLQGRATDDRAVRDQFDRVRNRIATIAELHAALYGSGRLGTVDFGDYLKEICAAIRQTLPATPAVDLRVRADSVMVSADTALSLGLIVNELVTNAAKHAFPERDRGSVTVDFEPVAGGLHLRIRDDGRGLPAADGSPSGLGTTLVAGFVQKEGGRLALSSDGGACFDILIPNGRGPNGEGAGHGAAGELEPGERAAAGRAPGARRDVSGTSGS
ncbi:sensor histidine kinase [Chthonobacter rhizosphaerae]|uniref:sensor histidine kinase n=1 Tax=Chthonobacter rhizosphaerae TaxID=2735553 RepID=UPI0015EF1F39|nr:histidine kinase dimerization/phosphoacceptor domain -containing protein [Chthonobacter rhizosphaerae]